MVQTVDLLKAIDLIYEAALDLRAWQSAMEALADMMGARAVSLIVADLTSDVRPFVVAPRSDPEWLQAYIERRATTNFLRERGIASPIGRVYQVEDLDIPRQQAC